MPDNTPATRSAFVPAVLWMAAFLAIGSAMISPIWSGAHLAYGGSDDVRMEMFAAGIGSPSGPDEYLYYSHMLVGTGVSSLYKARPDIPWYPVYLLSTIVVSQGVCAWVIMRLNVNSSVRKLFFSFLLIMGLAAWTQLRFTIVAVECSLAGILLILLALLEDRKEEGFPSWPIVIGWALVLFGGIIRLNAALMILGVLSLPGLCILLVRRRESRPLRHIVLAVTGIALLFASQSAHWKWYSRNSEWAAFRSEHDTAALLVNTRRIRHLFMKNDLATLPESGVSAIESADLSFNDVRSLICWYFADPDVLPDAKLKALWRSLSEHVVLDGTGIAESALRTKDRLKRTLEIWFFVLISGLILTVSGVDPGRKALAVLAWLGCLSTMFALEFLLKLPRDITVSLGCAAVAGSTVVLARSGQPMVVNNNDREPEDGTKPWHSIVILAGFAATIGVALMDLKLSRAAEARGTQLKQDMDSILKDRDHLYVIGLPFAFNLLPVLDPLDEWRDFRYIYLDGYQRSPHAKAKLQEAGIENLTKAIVQGDVKLIVHPFQVEILSKIIEEHYADWIRQEEIQGGAIEFRLIKAGTGFEVWQTFPSKHGKVVHIVRPKRTVRPDTE